MNVFFIGMGYMGFERLKAIYFFRKKYKLNILGFYDPKIKKINYKNLKIKSEKFFSNKYLIKNNIDICVVSVPHSHVFKYVTQCLKAKSKINLIVEKPLGININQSKKINSLKKRNQKIFVGLNYRFFPGVVKMLEDIKQRKFGKLNSLLINFGHGHNPNIKNSWKLKKKFAGGGVILDPGIHVLNLLQLFCTKLKIKFVKKIANFWKTGVEEEVIIILSSKEIEVINITFSILRWRSTFQINGNGLNGYFRLSGRDRSYGPQQYVTGKRWGWLSGKKQAQTEKKLKLNTQRNVFFDEINIILKSINNQKLDRKPCNEKESLEVMKLINRINDF